MSQPQHLRRFPAGAMMEGVDDTSLREQIMEIYDLPDVLRERWRAGWNGTPLWMAQDWTVEAGGYRLVIKNGAMVGLACDDEPYRFAGLSDAWAVSDRPFCLPGCDRLDGHDGRDPGACMQDGQVLVPGPLDLVHRHPDIPVHTPQRHRPEGWTVR